MTSDRIALAAAACTVAAALAVAPGPAAAQDAPGTGTLRAVEQDLSQVRDRTVALDRRAARTGLELAELRAELIADTQRAMALHYELLALEEELARLAVEEEARHAELAAARDRLARLGAALRRLQAVPAALVLAGPQPPLERVRAAALARGLVPALTRRAADLRAEVAALAEMRAERRARYAAAAALRADLNARLDAVGAQVERRQALLDETRRERQRLSAQSQRLIDEAAELRTLLRELEAQRTAEEARAGPLSWLPADAAAAPPGPPMGLSTAWTSAWSWGSWGAPGAARGDGTAAGVEPLPFTVPRSETTRPMLPVATVEGVILPASGVIVRGFGEAGGGRAGEASRGIMVAAYPGAPVVAPLDGTVRFAGPFNAYGQILILEHADGYHSVIAGVGRVDVDVGQEVLAGEPVAVTRLPERGRQDAPTVYYELRLDGRPVDPIRGLAAAQRRGRG